jgi:glyoxylase-like metal-dependent hydrolase (beta-lactamase superfamily II)
MLYFRQILAGREVARIHPVAGQMANFMYLVGDRRKQECFVVDPAWDVRGLLDEAARDGMKVTGALVTHYHPDHVGGGLFGQTIEGLATLLELQPARIYVNKHEADGVRKVTGVSETDLVRVDDGDTVKVGDLEVRFMHTPGHTPGSQCFLVSDRLVSGDTLFIGGCGRVDLPGSDPDQMYESLTQRLAKLPDDTLLFPGHHYSDQPSTTLGEEKRTNYYLRVPTLDDWRRLMGRG